MELSLCVLFLHYALDQIVISEHADKVIAEVMEQDVLQLIW
jgi:hypothetical protein